MKDKVYIHSLITFLRCKYQDIIKDIEQVQKRAARFVYNNYRSKEPGCATNMLDALNWEPPSQRRAKNRVTMLYKIINNQVTIDPNTYLNKSDTCTRGEHKYKQIATSKNIYKYSFPPRTIRSWNYLPAAVAQAPDLDSFRSGLEGIQFPPDFHLLNCKYVIM